MCELAHTPLRLLMRMALIIALAGLALASCSGDEGGRLQINLVDAPLLVDGVEAIDVTFSSVSTHTSASAGENTAGWTDILDDSQPAANRTFDLLELVNGVQATLALGELPEGRYTQIRIVVESASITVNGTTEALTIPSGEQTGIKLVGSFSISEGATYELTVDFDAARSVTETSSGYQLSPTYRVVHTAETGTVSGSVSPADAGATVAAYVDGADRSDSDNIVATAQVDASTGEYMISALEAGTYDLEVSASGYSTQVELGVEVSAGADNPDHDFTLSP